MSEIRHFHLFCGLGGGAHGFNQGHARIGRTEARFRCIGGVDSDPAAVRDFETLTGVPGAALDLFDRDQYRAFHGSEPPADWREATPADLHRAAGNERPNIVFTSPPCKGFSGLLSPARAGTDRYQALNALTVRGVWLALEAWADDPPEFFLLENVPRIQQRGRPLVDRISALLERYGYAVAETTHDCGELGALAQTRKRFLLVARHREKVPPFLYEPPKRPLRAVGQVLDDLPLPEDPRGGPMHRLPNLRWLTWVRLALIPAGRDWRALQDIDPAQYGLMPETAWHNGSMGVQPWDQPAGTITGNGRPATGRFAIADPRTPPWGDYHAYGVRPWDQPAETVTGRAQPGAGAFSVADPRPGASWSGKGKYQVAGMDDTARTVIAASETGNGAFAIADPRLPWNDSAYRNKLRVTPWDAAGGTVTGSTRPGSGAPSVADPRPARFNNVFRVVRYDETSPAVTGGAGPSSGGLTIADPRQCGKRPGGEYQSAGHYGVTPWGSHSRAVPGKAKLDTGPWSVADPRLPAPKDRVEPPLIIALDDTWHRPFTTLELAALQGFPVLEDDTALALDGKATSAWRERIGNAVPPPAAAAIASVMGQALLLAWAGESFVLSSTPVWVRDVAIALSADLPVSAVEDSQHGPR